MSSRFLNSLNKKNSLNNLNSYLVYNLQVHKKKRQRGENVRLSHFARKMDYWTF